jgi:hypothetical protein
VQLDPLISEGMEQNQVKTTNGSQVPVRKWEGKTPILERPGNRGGKRQEKATCPNLKQEVHLVLDLQFSL